MKSKDFPDKVQGKVVPYGVYDLTANEGWVSVGITHDTAEFAVESIRRWWYRMGREVYPGAKELLVTADSGGSNGSRLRLWKVGLQRLADELGVKISVCHFPPETSKWNKIEHRMFCHITENWRGRPLVSRAVIVNLIGDTRNAPTPCPETPPKGTVDTPVDPQDHPGLPTDTDKCQRNALGEPEKHPSLFRIRVTEDWEEPERTPPVLRVHVTKGRGKGGSRQARSLEHAEALFDWMHGQPRWLQFYTEVKVSFR